MDYIYSNLVSHDISSVILFILKGSLSRLNCLSWIFYSKFTINKGGFIKIHLLYTCYVYMLRELMSFSLFPI